MRTAANSEIIKKHLKDNAIYHILAFVLITYAFYQGFTSIRNLSWPCEIDLIRNTAEAQATLDGYLFDDPTYLGEKNWYSPLAHWTVALISSIVGIPPHIVFQRAGAYLNILVPISFYIFIAALMNPLIALASLFGMLFIFNNILPTCTSGTYTPILYSSHFAPWLFFLTLFLYIKASKTGKSRLYILTGLSLGITFLAHNSPALILGCIVFAVTIWRIWKSRGKENRRDVYKNLINFLLVTFSVVLTASPLLYSMLIKYKMQVLNERGTLYTLDFLRLDKIGEFLRLFNPGWIILLFLILGTIGFFRIAKKSEEARLLLISFLIVLLVFAYSYLWQFNNGLFHLPQLLPSFHNLVYIGFFEAILFGFGIYELLIITQKAMSYFIKKKTDISKKRQLTIEKATAVFFMVVVLGIFFFNTNSKYLSRQDFTALRHPLCAGADMKWYERLHNWVLANIPPDAVFLNDINTPEEILMTARKFVVHPIIPELSNPFVDYQKRLKDRDLMLLALEEGKYDTLLRLLKKYNTKYMISSAETYENYWNHPVFLKIVYNSEECTIFSINYAILKRLASSGDLVRDYPYILLENQKNLSTAISYNIEKRHFNYFEADTLKNVLDGWRWIDKRNIKTDMELLMQKMNPETVLIAKRRTAMQYINSSRTKPDFIKDYYFTGFTLPRKIIKLQKRNPEKVLIFRKNSSYYRVLASAGIKTYSLSDPHAILKERFANNESFVQEVCKMALNCEMMSRYAAEWDRKIRKGRAQPVDVVSSLLKQAASIDY